MKDKIILFGAGTYGREAYAKLREQYEIIGFADNYKKTGETICGVPIISIQKLVDYVRNYNVDIVVTTEAYSKIGLQLNELEIFDYYVMLHGHLYEKHRYYGKKVCCRCVMDNSSDKEILFDQHGFCNYCVESYNKIGKLYFPNEEGREKLKTLIADVKKDGEGKKYDCIMGISGGLDSSYLAYLGYKWGLRVLAVHVDDGFDTQISSSNIKKLIKATGFDFEVIKPDSTQFNALTKAYMKAGVPNIAVPQDNILFAFLYKKMEEYNIKYFLSGGNFALECILQKGNTHSAYDITNIMDIYNKYGSEPIDKLEFLSFKTLEEYERKLNIQSPRPLNFINYNKNQAFLELEEFCGFEYYGSKHLENILTAFIQLYWFPKKFGVDKRTSHLSSMIVSGQISREEALEILKQPLYDEKLMNDYINIIKEKLKITDIEFEEIIKSPIHQHEDYATE